MHTSPGWNAFSAETTTVAVQLLDDSEYLHSDDSVRNGVGIGVAVDGVVFAVFGDCVGCGDGLW